MKWPVVVLVILVVILLAWLLLMGMPFGRGGESPRETVAVETIAEGKVERGSETLAPNAEVEDEQPPPARPAPNVSTAPTTTAPMAAPPPTAPPPPAPSEREITESQAIAVLRGFVASHDEYLVRADCVRIASRGYRNAGYTLELYDTCESPGAPRSRWRVDSKTREVFVQRQDGRYLRP